MGPKRRTVDTMLGGSKEKGMYSTLMPTSHGKDASKQKVIGGRSRPSHAQGTRFQTFFSLRCRQCRRWVYRVHAYMLHQLIRNLLQDLSGSNGVDRRDLLCHVDAINWSLALEESLHQSLYDLDRWKTKDHVREDDDVVQSLPEAPTKRIFMVG